MLSPASSASAMVRSSPACAAASTRRGCAFHRCSRPAVLSSAISLKLCSTGWREACTRRWSCAAGGAYRHAQQGRVGKHDLRFRSCEVGNSMGSSRALSRVAAACHMSWQLAPRVPGAHLVQHQQWALIHAEHLLRPVSCLGLVCCCCCCRCVERRGW